jgi:hypothetical protein
MRRPHSSLSYMPPAPAACSPLGPANPISQQLAGADIVWGDSSKDARPVTKFCRQFNRMGKSDLGLVLFVAQKRARRKVVESRASEA